MTFNKRALTFTALLATAFLIINFGGLGQAQPSDETTTSNEERQRVEQVGEKPLLIFGFSEDSPPLSFSTNNDNNEVDPNTFCGNLFARIEDNFEDEYKIEQVRLYSNQRFHGFEGIDIPGYGFIDNKTEAIEFLLENRGIECGSNSIRGYRIEDLKTYGGAFSDSFYENSAKVLIRRKDRHLLHNRDFPLAAGKNGGNFDRAQIIAVVGGDRESGTPECNRLVSDEGDVRAGGTTTEDAINTIYGARVRPYASREQVALCLTRQDSPLLGYASDQILLQGLLDQYANRPELRGLKDFVIEPQSHNLTYERYGIVVYDGMEESDSELTLIMPAVNTWLQTEGNALMKSKSADLNRLLYTTEGPLSQLFWRPVSNFYRSTIPSFIASLGPIFTFTLFVLSVALIFLLLTHRWVASLLAKLFPRFFGLIISFRRFLRRKGDESGNSFIKRIGSLCLSPEELYAEAVKESRDSKAALDDYDISKTLEIQLRFRRYLDSLLREEGSDLDLDRAKQDVLDTAAEQMKHNPKTRKILVEWSKLFGDSFIENFSRTFGEGSAAKFLEIVNSSKNTES